MRQKLIFFIGLVLLVIPANHKAYAQECTGTSNEVSQADALNYGWTFQTTPANEAEITFECLDEKVGLVAFLWDQTNGFAETQMTNIPGTQKFTWTSAALSEGSTIVFSCKFAYAGGMSVTRQFEFTIGDCKEGSGADDTLAPADFTASVKNISYTSATIEVNATDDSGSVIYTISRNGADDIVFTAISGTATEKKITGLETGTDYTVTVSVKDAAGNTPENSPVTLNFTTLPGEESDCSGISGEVSQGEAVSYRWTTQTSATDQAVITIECLDEKTGLVAFFWDQTGGFTETQMTNEEGTQKFTYASDPQTPGTVITFSCKFAYAGGMSVTKQMQFTIGDCKESGETDTEAPADFTAAVKNTTATETIIEVKATDNSGSVIYTISRTNAEDITFTALSGTTTEKTVTGLTPGTAYEFSVSAKDAAGNTAANSPVTLNTTTLENQETGCSGTSAEISQDNPLTYGWEFNTTAANEVEITFECLEAKDGLVAFFWNQTNGFAETQMTNVPGTSKFTYKTAPLTPGEIILFSCKFAYAGGQSVTKQFEFTVGDCKEGGDITDTEAPVNFTAQVKTISYAEVTIEVNAEDNSGNVIYTIERDGAENIVFSAATGTATEKTIGNLTPGTDYTLRVHAKDASGNVAADSPASLFFTTLAADNTECDGIGYSYENDPGIKPVFHYHISTTSDMKVKVDLEFQQTVTGLVAQVLVLWPEGGDAILDCINEGNNKYTVTIPYNAAGDPFTAGQVATFKGRFPYAGGLALTTPFTYTVGNNCSGVGIMETGIQKEKLYISAGSFDNVLTVTGTTGIREWSLYTVQGKLIEKKQNNGNTITIQGEHLTPGLYLLITQDDQGNKGYLKIRK